MLKIVSSIRGNYFHILTGKELFIVSYFIFDSITPVTVTGNISLIYSLMLILLFEVELKVEVIVNF